MTNFTSNIYRLKRKILTFTNKLFRHFAKPEKKFATNITYGMLDSGSYRLAKGISDILSYAKEGIRLWFRTKRPACRQLCLKLIA